MRDGSKVPPAAHQNPIWVDLGPLFGVWMRDGLEFRVEGLGFKVQGVRFGV